MIENIPANDPAYNLWQKVDPYLLGVIDGLILEAPVPIGRIAEELGLDVVSLTLDSNISGLIRMTSDEPKAFEIQVNNTDAPVRQRFTVAHEIAHFLLHSDEIGTDGITDNILYRSKLSDRKEVEANKLAAALLLPWSKVIAWHQANFGCDPMVQNIDEIAKAFRVSSLAVGFRLRL